MSNTPAANTKTIEQIVKENSNVARIVMEDNAAARVALLLNLSVISADHLGTFDQTGPRPKAGEEDLMVHLAEDDTVVALYVRADAMEKLREAGYDI